MRLRSGWRNVRWLLNASSTNTNLYEFTNRMAATLIRNDIVYPELSYDLIGCSYDVFNELGFGHHEKYYQRAFAEALKLKSLTFTEQVYYPLKFKDKIIGKMFFDF